MPYRQKPKLFLQGQNINFDHGFSVNVVSIFLQDGGEKELNDNIFQDYLLELLHLNSKYDILNVGSAFDEITMSRKIDLVKKSHPYSITPPTSEKGRWQTRFKDENGNYKNIKAQTEEALWEKLIPLYFSNSHIDKSFHNIFVEWLDYKKELAGSPNTITRHKQHYRKYFEPSKLHTMKFKQIDCLLLETECNRIVKDFNLSRKEWMNIKTILLGMFEYASRKKYITFNPMNEVKILVKFRQVVKKSGKTQTYNTDELAELNRYLDAKYTETGDTAFLAVRLNFFLGLRVGELVALRWEDWEDETTLHIVREEVREHEKNIRYVANHTKTHLDRFVAIPPKAIELLKKIPRQGEYIFTRNGERITCSQIAYVLQKYAERQGVRTKSSHKIRKTYASLLASNGVPLDAIRELLGHTDLATTLGYIYNPLPEKDTYELISKAL